MKLIDMVGQHFGRLEVIGRAQRGAVSTGARWDCRCDCGRTTVAYGQDLRRGKQKSCGCLDAEHKFKHGKCGTPEYRAWQAMLDRCLNPKNRAWKNYGGRGITVCERWRDFRAFLADMGPKPDASMSIDRINNEGHYEPSNCRWATTRQQLNNRRNNVVIEWQGEKRTIAQWAKHLGIDDRILRQRLTDRQWPVQRAFTDSVGSPRLFHHNGQAKTLKEWALASSIGYETLRARVMRLGIGFEEAITRPVGRYSRKD